MEEGGVLESRTLQRHVVRMFKVFIRLGEMNMQARTKLCRKC